MSEAISAAMAVNAFHAKTGDVKDRERILRKDWRREGKDAKTGDVEPLRSLGDWSSGEV